MFDASGVPVNSDKCVSTAGAQQLTGVSGKEHNVNVVFGQDGALWLRFGMDNMKKSWRNKNSWSSKFEAKLFSHAERAAMNDFNFLDYYVESDVKFQVKAGNSWHPSSVQVRKYINNQIKFQDICHQFVC